MALAAHSATSAELESEQAKRIEAEIQAQNVLSEKLAALQKQAEKFHDFAGMIGRAAKTAFLWGTAPVLLLCGYVSLPSSVLSASHPLWRYIVSILLFVSAVWSFAGAFFGVSIIGVARQIEVRTTERIERFLVSRFGV